MPIVVSILLVVLSLAIGKNLIAQAVIENGVRILTGLPLKMGRFDFSLLKTNVGIWDLKLYNPAGYPDKVMVQVPEIYIDYDLAALLRGAAHFEEIRIHLKEFVVIKNDKGELNLNSLKALQASQGAKKPAVDARPEPGKKAKASKMQIGRLSLQMEKVIYKDYSKSGEPSTREFNLNVNEQYQDIKNLNFVVGIIVLKMMLHTPLANLTNFDVAGLKANVSEALTSASKLADEATAKASAAVEEATQAARELAEKAPVDFKGATTEFQQKTRALTEGLKGKTGDLKEKLKFNFGKGE